jgi:hypothetical protein
MHIVIQFAVTDVLPGVNGTVEVIVLVGVVKDVHIVVEL